VNQHRLSWAKLLSKDRFEEDKDGDAVPDPLWLISSRTEAERDFDRILFSTPTRRLGDKTQVFPLDRNESVRTRLTHSHEVSNLARSIGNHLVHRVGSRLMADAESDGADQTLVIRAVPAMLAAVGLAHDLGNPPFGHQGEEAIRSWIKRRQPDIFPSNPETGPYVEGNDKVGADILTLTPAHKQDFLQFEGNAQTLRTVSRLQLVRDARGLNLTFGTLAALMKYTVPSGSINAKTGTAATKKIGFFSSERRLVEHIHSITGLHEGLRHPLTYIMEACDDIAYSIVDAEDAIKKQIVSFADLIYWIQHHEEFSKHGDDGVAQWVVKKAEHESKKARDGGLSPAERNDVSVQLFRAHGIGAMVSAVIAAFEANYDQIITGKFSQPLIEASSAKSFCRMLKDFDREHAYKNRRVLEIELDGFNVIQDLMDMLWQGIVTRENFTDLSSERTSPFSRYAYGRISENYRRVFEGRVRFPFFNEKDLPIRYRELQLLTDMISGMTDQFALDLRSELKGFHVGASA
jgi:dGTPase